MGQWRRSEFFRSFPRFLGNWLAGDAVSYPILETGWLAQEVRFPTQTILLYVMLACVERSLERRGVEPFLVRMELQSIIRYVASLERDCEEWCAYHFPCMPEDAGPRTRPHLERLAEQANL